MRKIYIFNEDRKGFGQNLKLLMKKNGYTVEKLADELGYDINTVKKWRSGSRVPSLETLLKIASLFGVSVQRLYLPNSIFEKPISDCLSQIIDGRVSLSECDNRAIDELHHYCDYLFQKMLFSYLTINDKKTMTNLFVYYDLTKYGLDKLELSDCYYDFETFLLKTKEYVIKQYGVSFPYKVDSNKSAALLKEFDKWITFKGGSNNAISQ